MAKAKVIQTDHACIVLVEGDKSKRLEPAENIIKFPGGSISVTRTSNNEYWAHIEVNHSEVLEDTHRESRRGDIVNSRIEYNYPANPNIVEIDHHENVNHIAVRIKTK